MTREFRKRLGFIATAFVIIASMAACSADVSAKTIEADITPYGGHYDFEISGGELFNIWSPATGVEYTNRISFKNDTSQPMKISLTGVTHLTDDTDIWKNSYMKITIDEVEYDGLLADASFSTTVPAESRKAVTFAYLLYPEGTHAPVNDTMGQIMKFRLTFVGEYDLTYSEAENGGRRGARTAIGSMLRSLASPKTGDTMQPYLFAAIAGACVILLVMMLQRRKQNDGDEGPDP